MKLRRSEAENIKPDRHRVTPYPKAWPLVLSGSQAPFSILIEMGVS